MRTTLACGAVSTTVGVRDIENGRYRAIPATNWHHPKPKARRTRTGCLTCKRRRVRCDEIKPACGPCRYMQLGCEGAAYNRLRDWNKVVVRQTPVVEPETYHSHLNNYSDTASQHPLSSNLSPSARQQLEGHAGMLLTPLQSCYPHAKLIQSIPVSCDCNKHFERKAEDLDPPSNSDSSRDDIVAARVYHQPKGNRDHSFPTIWTFAAGYGSSIEDLGHFLDTMFCEQICAQMIPTMVTGASNPVLKALKPLMESSNIVRLCVRSLTGFFLESRGGPSLNSSVMPLKLKGDAIRQLAESIKDPKAARSDECLAATLLLSVCEEVSCSFYRLRHVSIP